MKERKKRKKIKNKKITMIEEIVN